MGPAGCVALGLLLYFRMCSSFFVDVPRLKLNNGDLIPAIALGTYLGFDQNGVMRSQNKHLRDVVRRALEVGYRHLDCASVYLTEEEVGEAIRDKVSDGSVKRSDVFVTTKLWNTDHGRVEEALRESLGRLGLDYVDLYLMHWPIALNEDYSHSDQDYMETWRAMERVQRAGLARSIGLSNFNRDQLARVLKEAEVKPAALEIEVHPQIAQQELVSYAQAHGVVVMGYSPLGPLAPRYGQESGGPRADQPPLAEMARRANKTAPQLVLRWLVERQVIPISKTVNLKRLEENLNIFDFHLTPEDMAALSVFDVQKRYTLPSFWQNHPHYPFEKVENPPADPFAKTK